MQGGRHKTLSRLIKLEGGRATEGRNQWQSPLGERMTEACRMKRVIVTPPNLAYCQLLDECACFCVRVCVVRCCIRMLLKQVCVSCRGVVLDAERQRDEQRWQWRCSLVQPRFDPFVNIQSDSSLWLAPPWYSHHSHDSWDVRRANATVLWGAGQICI